MFAVVQPDGSRHVVVDTQDEWTTRVNLGVNVDAGVHVETLSLTEDDLAGRGIGATLFYHQRQERKDAGVRLDFPRVVGTRTNALLAAGRTRVGTFRMEGLSYPFVGELGHVAWRQTYSRSDELFPYAVGFGQPWSHVLLPYVAERFEVSAAKRFGRPGDLTLVGLSVSRDRLDFNGFPASLEIARNGNFDAREPAPDSLDGVVARQTVAG